MKRLNGALLAHLCSIRSHQCRYDRRGRGKVRSTSPASQKFVRIQVPETFDPFRVMTLSPAPWKIRESSGRELKSLRYSRWIRVKREREWGETHVAQTLAETMHRPAIVGEDTDHCARLAHACELSNGITLRLDVLQNANGNDTVEALVSEGELRCIRRHQHRRPVSQLRL